ncbi:hypothetical protein [Cognatishimia sp. F0-27]|uniref:hypothetical protein n=1 Tax=Cognatishimia sp. F0-27 TaxID=2816855 RepID=UPI001D0C53C8|nr:hypothetical protein [Cognatishimia sp. F0-27]MCC1493786.1 hypothetical protein [Cognatishimia sp. F0-27]
MIRAIALLVLAIGASILATLYFGNEVLIALGLILTQSKVLLQKIVSLKPALVLAWIKAHGIVFFKKDLPYRWVSSVLVPLVLGKALAKRIGLIVDRLTAPIVQQRALLMAWYRGRSGLEKGLLTVALVAATLALSVTTIGLWLILFSISLPLWLVSTALALGKALSRTVQKSLFRAVAFLQLKWVSRLLVRILPKQWVARKRRFDFRMARAVVRRRRMTVEQLAARKDKLPFQAGVFLEFLLIPPKRDKDGKPEG